LHQEFRPLKAGLHFIRYICTGYVINRDCELDVFPFPRKPDVRLYVRYNRYAWRFSQISCNFMSLSARLRFDLARFRRDFSAEE
jgi:hypothetical protein